MVTNSSDLDEIPTFKRMVINMLIDLKEDKNP